VSGNVDPLPTDSWVTRHTVQLMRVMDRPAVARWPDPGRVSISSAGGDMRAPSRRSGPLARRWTRSPLPGVCGPTVGGLNILIVRVAIPPMPDSARRSGSASPDDGATTFDGSVVIGSKVETSASSQGGTAAMVGRHVSSPGGGASDARMVTLDLHGSEERRWLKSHVAAGNDSVTVGFHSPCRARGAGLRCSLQRRARWLRPSRGVPSGPRSRCRSPRSPHRSD